MIPVALDKNTVYATKGNIAAPTGSVAATIAAAAQSRMNDALATADPTLADITVTVPAGAVKVAL